MPTTNNGQFLDLVEEASLRRWVERLSILRHGQTNPEAIEKTGKVIEAHFENLGMPHERDTFEFQGRPFFNVLATLPGRDRGLPPYIIGAHYDAAIGSPGADDNASAVAAMLVAATVLSQVHRRRTIRFVGFSIEEPQNIADRACRHGSRHFARRAFFRWERYAGVFILESVGYTSDAPGSQRLPVRLPIPIPTTGTFLGVVGNRRAKKIIQIFEEAVKVHEPGLEVVSHRFLCNGWLVPATRMSDHAPFWDCGYPAVMLTDTAFLRNPNYHQETDLPETLDFSFLTRVTRALVATLWEG